MHTENNQNLNEEMTYTKRFIVYSADSVPQQSSEGLTGTFTFEEWRLVAQAVTSAIRPRL